jgi:hypothetical protein
VARRPIVIVVTLMESKMKKFKNVAGIIIVGTLLGACSTGTATRGAGEAKLNLLTADQVEVLSGDKSDDVVRDSVDGGVVVPKL